MKKICFLFALLLIVCTSANVLAAESTKKIDLDLSRLSGTVVYSQIYNILYDPEPFLGKTLKIAGYYSPFEDYDTDNIYHACIIPDATACCAQGLEFVWEGDHIWPDDYPEEGTDITVAGRLETYEEDGILYLHLADAELTWDAALD